jgi:hypothetical protein
MSYFKKPFWSFRSNLNWWATLIIVALIFIPIFVPISILVLGMGFIITPDVVVDKDLQNTKITLERRNVLLKQRQQLMCQIKTIEGELDGV